MKKLSRMTALMLALMMLVTSVPITALAEITLDTSTWQSWVNEIKQTFQQAQSTTEPFEEKVTVPVTYTVPVATQSYTTAESAISMSAEGTAELTAVNGAGQWQVLAGEKWVNIAGATDATLFLNKALLNSATSGSTVQVRCLSDGEGDGVTVNLTSAAAYTTAETDMILLVTGTRTKSSTQAFTAADLGISVYDDNNVKTTYTVTIKYQFKDGQQAAASKIMQLIEGEPYEETYDSPEVQGYAPDQKSVTVSYNGVAEPKLEYVVTYSPVAVEYKVEHSFQSLNDEDKYELKYTDELTGLTGSMAVVTLRTEAGFTALPYVIPAIAADGSTVVKVQYARNYYLMNFDMDGGYGTEPVYARYGANIGKVTNPTKAGYTFAGWAETKGETAPDKAVKLPETMPADNKTYYAIWTPNDQVAYTVVYWRENADPDEDGKYGYSYWGQKTAYAKPETTVDGWDIVPESDSERRFFTFEKADQNVFVRGDGKTIVNVYYSRNTYTINFYAFTNNSRAYTRKAMEVVYTISAKYEQNVGEIWPDNKLLYAERDKNNVKVDSANELVVATDNNNSPFIGWWYTKNSTSDVSIGAAGDQNKETLATTRVIQLPAAWCNTQEGGNNTSNVYAYYNGKNATFNIYYMFESLNQTDDISADGVSRTQYNDRYYDMSEDYSALNKVNTTGSVNPKSNIPGYGDCVYKTGDILSTYEEDHLYNLYFYYNRKRANIQFYSFSKVEEGNTISDVMYEQPLKDYATKIGKIKPALPDDADKDAWTFTGKWYTTKDCIPGTEFNPETATMPATDLLLYAEWVPTVHTVNFYLDKDAYEAQTLIEQGTKAVTHGEYLTDIPEVTKGSYEFIGWFYMEDGKEKAFDFANMQVRKELNVYGKWHSSQIVSYTIKFVLKEDHATEVAAPVSGQGYVMDPVTYTAKYNTELYADYQSGYFPTVTSQSINLESVEEGKADQNVIVFEYVKTTVPYQVEYRYKETDKLVEGVATKVVENNVYAYVTEQYVVVPGYVPDEVQKSLQLYVRYDSDGNEDKTIDAMRTIIFYYSKSENTAVYTLKHYVEDATEQGGWRLVQTDVGQGYTNGENVAVVSANYHTYDGYTADETLTTYVVGNGEAEKYQGPLTLTNKGLTINHYYKENQVTINYVAVGPEGATNFGSVAPESETVKVLSGTAQGSTPTAGDGFKFVGWFKDEDCTQPVEGEGWLTGDKIVPQKIKPIGEGENVAQMYETATYYAKFEYNLTTLTIKKAGCDTTLDAGQSFLFKVTGKGLPNDGLLIAINGNGSETISGLTVGETYTVTEVEAWSWRYSASAKEITLSSDTTENTVTIENVRANVYWLDGDCYAENVFGTASGN